MTLILNEIHLEDGLNKTFMVAAADRQLSKNGRPHSVRQKLFEIEYLKGAVSYFGLAEVFPEGKQQYLSEWLPNFIRNQSACGTLERFSSNLRDQLNGIVPPSILLGNPSGFHICGYDRNGLPDFWYVSNIGRWDSFRYLDLKSRYQTAESHFLARDAIDLFKWDRKDPCSAGNGIGIYRNGDARAHVAAWEQLDEIYRRLNSISKSEFKIPTSREDYGRYTRFKFEFVAYLYKKWAKQKIIGRPIDVLILTNQHISQIN